MASIACFLHHHTAAIRTCSYSSSTAQRYAPPLKPSQLVCRSVQKQAAADGGSAAVVSRRLALVILIGAATAVGSKVSPADAAYGESANIFGKPKTNTDFKPYTGDGFKVSIPSKWNPSKEREFPGQVLRYEDNFDATSNLSVMITPTDKKSITDYGSPEDFLSQCSVGVKISFEVMNNIMKEKLVVFLIVEEIILQSMFFMQMFVNYTGRNQRRQHINNRRRYSMISRIPDQVNNMYRLIEFTDDACVDNLRMNRNAFGRLCYLLHHVGGLVESRSVNVPEKVAMFLQVIAHHTKNRIVKHNFTRSGHTVSKYFNDVLKAVLKLHPILLIEPEAISTDCKNPRWKCFQGCLGALDGTYIKVKVAETDKPRYRNRKGDISVNVLGVCNRKMNFIYVLPGWEGSAADGRVLRDAISRPHGLKVPNGHYYLCDNGYANSEGFLTPYKSVRYHLDEWGDGSRAPRNYEEYFNMKHTKARNIIERAFGLLKERWGILRTYSSYPIKTHNHIIMACCLLHNFIRAEMDIDPLENFQCELDDDRYLDREFLSTIDPSPQWNSWRDTLALNMFTEWRGAR